MALEPALEVERPLTDHPAFDGYAGWTPDGQTIVFQSDRSGRDAIWAMGSDGTAPHEISDGRAHDVTPRPMPDGHSIVLAGDLDGTMDLLLPLAR